MSTGQGKHRQIGDFLQTELVVLKGLQWPLDWSLYILTIHSYIFIPQNEYEPSVDYCTIRSIKLFGRYLKSPGRILGRILILIHTVLYVKTDDGDSFCYYQLGYLLCKQMCDSLLAILNMELLLHLLEAMFEKL